MQQRTSEPPLISLLATGGTIAGKSTDGGATNYRSGEVPAEELLRAAPGLNRIAAVRCRQIANIGSEDMVPEVWLDLAREVARETADPAVSGVVILHGTDTMEETAFFLDLTGAAAKPVAMTGAMRPADAASPDGPANILDAVRTAASPLATGRGVLVVMNGVIHAARRVAKADTLSVDAFRSEEGPEGRMVGGAARFFGTAGASGARFDLSGVTELPRVEIIYGHTGQRRELVDAAVAAGAWGIVHAGVGMGNVHRDVRPALAEAATGGVVVVCASRVPCGPVPLTDRLRRDGFLAAGGLNPQKARVLLQLALARGDRAAGIQKLFASF